MFDLDNGITLCINCHNKEHNNYLFDKYTNEIQQLYQQLKKYKVSSKYINHIKRKLLRYNNIYPRTKIEKLFNKYQIVTKILLKYKLKQQLKQNKKYNYYSKKGYYPLQKLQKQVICIRRRNGRDTRLISKSIP
jgi:hypothetical protein